MQTSRITITLSLLTLLIFLPTTALAQNFVELVGIPYIDKVSDGSGGLGAYANSLYLVAISIAAILAVLKIVIAGVKYMVTDIVTTKGQAKNDIKNALLGLLVVVGAFLILETINPDLTRLTALNLDPVTAQLKKHKIETGNCVHTKVVDVGTGATTCIDDQVNPGEKCDTSLGGGLCGCNERLVAGNTINGYACEALQTSSPSPSPDHQTQADNSCVNTEHPVCPCGKRAIAAIAGYSQCIDITDPTSSKNKIQFNGETVDTSISYTFNEPAIEGLEAGELHGEPLTIIDLVEKSGSVTDANGETAAGSSYFFLVMLTDGSKKEIGCALISPQPNGCN